MDYSGLNTAEITTSIIRPPTTLGEHHHLPPPLLLCKHSQISGKHFHNFLLKDDAVIHHLESDHIVTDTRGPNTYVHPPPPHQDVLLLVIGVVIEVRVQ